MQPPHQNATHVLSKSVLGRGIDELLLSVDY